MRLSIYTASVPVFRQILGALSGVLTKAEAHAESKKIAPDALLQARLYPDMFALTRQVQVAADFAKSLSARLANVPVPTFEDTERTFADLQARIAKTLSFIDTLPESAFDATDDRTVVIQPGTPRERSLDARTYLMSYGLPNFFFHVTTAYAILRHNGVEVGKRDYIGTF
ncbi:MAG: DUF1993 domain-containing protein [Burkholderiaceae bacterium]|nr:DUF1993 domain-containing protein [Burkholderiaceae bacterium]MDO9089784.1 DUF1993 domain-containing protein [Burkholderiaceae bacterium]